MSQKKTDLSLIQVPGGSASQYSETLIYATYYAPRGRQRLYLLGAELAHRYLLPSDLLVGIIGAEGSGKSTLIRGLFPGLELTNDDDGVNVRPAQLYGFSADDYFAPHTFHIDVRYERAFRQNWQIAEAITAAVSHGRRVVVEHFDLIHEALGYNAQIIFGIGEEVIVARPSVFGPFPDAIKAVVDRTVTLPVHGPHGGGPDRLRAAARLQLPHPRAPLRREARLRHQLPGEAAHRPRPSRDPGAGADRRGPAGRDRGRGPHLHRREPRSPARARAPT